MEGSPCWLPRQLRKNAEVGSDQRTYGRPLASTRSMKTLPFYIFLLLLACREHAPLEESYGCITDFTTPAVASDDSAFACCNCAFDWEEITSGGIRYDYLYPYTNPENNNQVVYCFRDNAHAYTPGYELWLLDFCSKSRKKLATGASSSGCSWGPHNWVIFTTIGQEIYKVKSNGDSLTQLVFNSNDYNRSPRFNLSRDKFAYQTENSGLGIVYFLIQDFYSGQTDTITSMKYAETWEWVNDHELFFTTLNHDLSLDLNIYNISTKKSIKLNNLPCAQLLDYVIFNVMPVSSENALLWCTPKRIGKIDLSTGEYQILSTAFRQENYLGISAYDSNHFILNKQIKHQIDDCHIDSDYAFFVVNRNAFEISRVLMED